MSRRSLARPLSLLASGALLLALFYGGTLPWAGVLFPAPWDKLAHVTFFFLLTRLLSRALPGPWWLGGVLALLLGMIDEWRQIYLPGREASVFDWLADGVGVALAWAAGRYARRARRAPPEVMARTVSPGGPGVHSGLRAAPCKRRLSDSPSAAD